MKKHILLSLFFFFIFEGFACPNFYYPNEKKPDTARVIFQKILINKNTNTGLAWHYSAPKLFFNSVVFRFPKGMLINAKFQIGFNHRYVDTADEWGLPHFRRENKQIYKDDHVDLVDADQSNLYFAGNDCFTFYLEQMEGVTPDSFWVETILIYVPPFALNNSKLLLPRAACSSPSVISQKTWRTGLPLPKPGRTKTPTAHCIIHHSADGNGNANYTDMVRSYYTYHTTVNGWDDIGYNYLVAANGDVYAGRDPEKAGIDQDNVAGAHFCAKNNFTMGVCMIGEFTTQKPTEAAMASLVALLGWKIHKDTLNPFLSYPHPDKNGKLLGTIAGHRDGCNTECPGNLLYNSIQRVKTDLEPCIIGEEKSPLFVFSKGGMVHVKNAGQGNTLVFFDLKGAKLKEVKNAWEVEEIIDLTAGRLLILAEMKDGRILNSKLFYHNY